MRRPTSILMIFALALSFSAIHSTSAQDDSRQTRQNASDEPGPADRIDLAAIALSSEDVPSGYRLNGETYTNAADIAGSLIGGDIPDADVNAIDMRWYYQSEYQTTDGQNRIRSYAEEFGSESGARSGFDLLENEALFARPGVNTVEKPGLGIGEEPSEVTVITFAASGDAPAGASIDATFRIDRLLVGVALDTISTEPPDEVLLATLAQITAERARLVLKGDIPSGVDTSLSGHLLSFGDSISVQDGYVTLTDLVGDMAPQLALEQFQSSYLRVVALDSVDNPDIPLPIVSVAVSTFESEAGAISVISDAETLTPPFDQLQRERTEPISGTSASVAFSFANPFESGSPDSYRILVVTGATLVTIDVEGANSLDDAKSAAMALLDQQLKCIIDSCGIAEIPSEIAGAKG